MLQFQTMLLKLSMVKNYLKKSNSLKIFVLSEKQLNVSTDVVVISNDIQVSILLLLISVFCLRELADWNHSCTILGVALV